MDTPEVSIRGGPVMLLSSEREITVVGEAGDGPRTPLRRLRAGASGYLLKHAGPHDLPAGVRRVAGGDYWLDPAVAGQVIRALGEAPVEQRRWGVAGPAHPARAGGVALDGQWHVGAGDQQPLRAQRATVKTHVARILLKTGSRDRAQAVVVAYRGGLMLPGRDEG